MMKNIGIHAWYTVFRSIFCHKSQCLTCQSHYVPHLESGDVSYTCFPPLPLLHPERNVKGFEIGCELGFYQACCRTWLEVMKRRAAALAAREEAEEEEEEEGTTGAGATAAGGDEGVEQETAIAEGLTGDEPLAENVER